MKIVLIFLSMIFLSLLAGCGTMSCGYQPTCSQTYIVKTPCQTTCKARTCYSCPYKISSCTACYGYMSYQTCYSCPTSPCQTGCGWI